jgi:hypothetical protein
MSYINRSTQKIKQFSKTHRGFTVLMAVLVAVLILAISASIVRIVLKQVKFSGSGRESQIAYYVADTGIECALLWDFRSLELFVDGDGVGAEVFPDSASTPAVDDTNAGVISTVRCGEGSIIANNLPQLGGVYEWETPVFEEDRVTRIFQFVLEDAGKYMCGRVQVEKWFDNDIGRIRTRVDSRGYNNCDTANPTSRYERGLRVNY